MPRKQKTIHYLYKTTCLVTERYYIGMHSTNNLDDGYMGSGRRLRASIRKHGEDKHVKEILEFFDSRELLIEAEINAITDDMINDPNCMNLMGGGKGGYVSDEHYERLKILASEHQKKMWANDEYRKKITESAREQMVLKHKAGKIKYNTFTGKKHSEETKKKMSESSKNQGNKPVNCYDLDGKLIKEYKSVKETKNDGFSPRKVSDCCNNKQKTHKGCVFKHKE